MTLPITATDFAALMAPLAPFEPAPVVAVAVSGGADSMALALLAADWVRERGGEAVALTVDHGLRAESAAEAATVGAWLRARGIAHHILCWQGTKPAADLQAAARAARYRLLEAWCREHGVLHLLLAHHREDQAETLLLRLGRGSGVDGLSAMAAVQEARFLRLLRPLLGVAAARLRATLRAAGQEWVEDPSNGNPAFGRVRVRQMMPALAAEGMSSARLAATARRLGRARDALDRDVARAAARFVTVHAGGWAEVVPDAFARLPDEIGLRLASRLLQAVGGGVYTPRHQHIEGLYGALRAGLTSARTLAGCKVVPGLVFCREPARVAPPVALAPGREAEWDGRFRIRAPRDLPPGLTVGALGVTGWRKVAALAGRLPPVPAAVRASLPAVYDDDAIFAVPHLGYNRVAGLECDSAWFVAAPPNPLTVAGRCLV
ncbi:MAG: tRNA lysidine(34) synthetase TilS [Solirubrobacterales bacterium]